MKDKGINKKAIEEAFKKINDSLPKVEINDGFKFAVMNSSLLESKHWKQFWELLKKIFEDGEENFRNKYFVPILTQFQGYLFDELYSDYQLYQKQKNVIKNNDFETKYFVFRTVNNSFKLKLTEIENYIINLFFLPTIFLKTSETNSNKMSLIIEELQNKRRTFPIELMKKIKEIESKEKCSIPKPTQQECVILANREMNEYDESALIDGYCKATQLLISITNSYKSQKKTL